MLLRLFAFVLLGLVIVFHFSPYYSYLFFLSSNLDLKFVRCMLININVIHLHFTMNFIGNVFKYLENLVFSRIFFNCFFFQRGCDSYMVYLFDKSKTVYEGPFASRSLSDCVNYIGKYSSYTDRGLKLK